MLGKCAQPDWVVQALGETPESIEQLTKMGHILEVRKEYSTTMGRGQAVLHDSTTKVNCGASDPRADGAAVPEAPQIFGSTP